MIYWIIKNYVFINDYEPTEQPTESKDEAKEEVK